MPPALDQPRALPGELRVCAAVGLAAAALYLSTLSRFYSGDSLYFALAIDAKSWTPRIDAYHLFLHPLGWAWVQLWRGLGWSGLSIHALQALNAIAGAVALALAGSIAARACGSLSAAALAAAGCAVSGGLWLLSTEAEDVTLGLVAHLAVLALLLHLPAGGDRRVSASLGVGAAVGLASLTYANCALLLGVAALAHWQGRRSSGTWFRSLAWVGAGFLAVVLPAAIFVTSVQVGLSNWTAMLSKYGGASDFGTLSWGSLPRGSYALLRMLVLYPGLGLNDRSTLYLAQADTAQRAVFAATYLAVAVAALAPLVLLWKHRHVWSRDFRQRLLLWAALYAGFAFWWVPSDLEFWLPLGVGWWIAVAPLIALGAIPRPAAVAAAVVLLAVNGLGLILPHADASRNEPLQIALALGPRLQPADAVVASPGVHHLMLYFARRDSIRIDGEASLEQAVDKAGRQAARRDGRVFVAGIPLDEGQRALWEARPLSGVEPVVWKLGADDTTPPGSDIRRARRYVEEE